MKLRIEDVPDCFENAAECLYPSQDSKQNRVYINVNKLLSYYTWSSTVASQLKEELNDILYEDTGFEHGFNPNSPKQLLEKLTNFYDIPQSCFRDNTGRTSTSGEVLKSLPSKYKNRFISVLLEYRKHQSKVTNLGQFLNYIDRVPKVRNNEGDLTMEIAVHYEKVNTHRFQANTPSFQNIAREDTDIITAPEGWVVFSTDSGQIEPRLYHSLVVKDPLIDKLIEEYDDVYYAIADYCLRDSIEYNEGNLEKHGSISKSKRNSFKTLNNGGAYGAGKNKIESLCRKIVFDEFEKTNPEDNKLIRKITRMKIDLERPNLPQSVRNNMTRDYMRAKEMLDSLHEEANFLRDRFLERFVNHPQRIKFLADVEDSIMVGGGRVFTTIFGDEIYARGPKYYLLNCAINNPLQGAVARLSAYTVTKAFEFIERNGLKDVLLYSLCKHDQDLYTVRKEVLPFVVEPLSDLRAYEIEGLHPIRSDIEIGLDYVK